MARIRRPAAEWAALIDQWRRSGLSLPAFCQRRGLSTARCRGGSTSPSHKRAIERAPDEKPRDAVKDPPAIRPRRPHSCRSGSSRPLRA